MANTDAIIMPHVQLLDHPTHARVTKGTVEMEDSVQVSERRNVLL